MLMVYNQWYKGIQVIILKEKGNLWSEKLRTIPPIIVEYNEPAKLMVRKLLIPRAENLGLFTEG